MNLIIDASVAMKWILPEEFSEQAITLLDSEDELYAPEFLLIEIANALWRKCLGGELVVADAKLALSEMQILIPDMEERSDLLPTAVEMAVALEHPVYDCVYLALAHQVDGMVITADRRFYNRVEGTPYQDVMVYLPNFRIN